MWWRAFVVMIAVSLGLTGTIQASAQISDSGVPAGAIDGAAISYQPAEVSFDAPTATYFNLLVFTFADDDAATTAQDALPQQIADVVSGGVEHDAADRPGLVQVNGADLDGLDGIGEDARAYEQRFDEGSGGSSIGLLTVREGANVFIWVAFALDFGAVLGDEGTPTVTPSSTPTSAGAGQGVTDLVEIADTWFNGDKPEGGALIDQLPTVDQLPEGYVATERYENLDDFDNAGSGFSGLARAA